MYVEDWMRSQEVIPSVVWMIIGVIICVASVPLKLGLWRHPGPGLFPFLVGCGMVLVSTYQVIAQLLKESESVKFWPYPGGVKRMIGLLLVLIFYAVTLKYLGYMLCTFVFFIVLFRTLGQKGWKYAILTSMTVSVISYMVFQIWLKINLPKGPLGL